MDDIRQMCPPFRKKDYAITYVTLFRPARQLLEHAYGQKVENFRQRGWRIADTDYKVAVQGNKSVQRAVAHNAKAAHTLRIINPKSLNAEGLLLHRVITAASTFNPYELQALATVASVIPGMVKVVQENTEKAVRKDIVDRLTSHYGLSSPKVSRPRRAARQPIEEFKAEEKTNPSGLPAIDLVESKEGLFSFVSAKIPEAPHAQARAPRNPKKDPK